MSFGTPRRLGRYEILEPIGVGGMGEVFLGRTILAGGIEKRVAIKRVHPSLAADPDLASMFLQEARLSTILEHPNIVHVSEVGHEDGDLFMVMTFLEGASLAKISRRMSKHRSKWPVGAAIEVMLGLLGGLSHAHTRRAYDGTVLSIVHRDISPQNVFVTFEGVVKVLDFGIAKAANSQPVTMVGQRKGKRGYMAPEQALGLAVDARADIYAAGVVLYEMLTCRKPYQPILSVDGVLSAPEGGRAAPVSSLRPDVPVHLDGVLEQALARDPGRRFQTADAFRDALEDFCREASVSRGLRQLAGIVQRFAPRGDNANLEELPTRVRTPARAEGPVDEIARLHESSEDTQDATPTPVPKPVRRPRWTPWLVGGGLLVAIGSAAAAVALSDGGSPAGGGSAATTDPSTSDDQPLERVGDAQLLQLLSESDPARALGPAARKGVVSELRRRNGSTVGIDMRNQVMLDLLQIEHASHPCAVLEAALEHIDRDPSRDYLPALVHASDRLDGTESECPRAVERLNALVLESITSSRSSG